MIKRLVFVLGLAIGLSLLTVSPASAHTGGGSTASNYESKITGVTPAVRGLHLEVKDAGDRLQLINNSGKDITIIGYDGEPYMKVNASGGVWENRTSPTYFLNQDRYATTGVPKDATPLTPPEWHRVSDGAMVVWHDHRAHWMSRQEPPQVAAARNIEHVLNPQWEVPLVVGTQPVEASGTLTWIPSSENSSIWYAVIVLTFAIALALRRVLTIGTFLVLVSAVIAMTSTTHLVLARAASSGSVVTRIMAGGPNDLSILVMWSAFVLVSKSSYRSRTVDISYSAAFVITVGMLMSGLTDFGTLTASQVVFSASPIVAKTLISLCIGLGTGALVVITWELRGRNVRASVPRTAFGRSEAEELSEFELRLISR